MEELKVMKEFEEVETTEPIDEKCIKVLEQEKERYPHFNYEAEKHTLRNGYTSLSITIYWRGLKLNTVSVKESESSVLCSMMDILGVLTYYDIDIEYGQHPDFCKKENQNG